MINPVQIRSDERSSCLLKDSTLDTTIETFNKSGFVILDNVLPGSLISALRIEVNKELSKKYCGKSDKTKHKMGHGGIIAPLRPPFIDPSIIENPLVLQILERLFGKYFYGCFPYGCNTAFPGSAAQNIHRDCGHLFPELHVKTPPVLIVVNISLDKFTDANGATEIWPGSHQEMMDETHEIETLRVNPGRALERDSVRTLMSSGSIVLRDMRTWHRGMPNFTNKSRTMLSLVYYRQYYLPDGLSLPIPVDSGGFWDQLSPRAKRIYRLKE